MKPYLHKNNDKDVFTHSRTKKITKGELYMDDTLFYKTNIKATVFPAPENQYIIETDLKKYIKSFNTAVDVGARVGEWSRPLGKYFNNVISFEAREKWCLSFIKNVIMENATLYNYALGNTNSWARMSGNRIKGDSEEYKTLIHKTST